MRPEHLLAAAVDIGGTNTVFGLVKGSGEILFRGRVGTQGFPTAKNLVGAVCDNLKEYLQASNHTDLMTGVGIGAPNGNFYSRSIEFAPNLPWKGAIPLGKLFEDSLGVPAYLTNDANAAALGEMVFGGAGQERDFLFVTLGTGLGSGIVVDGRLVYGHDGFAGELGHVIVFQDGRPCGCGRRGCLETYCSATGLRKTYAELSGVEFGSDTPDSKTIYEKAIEGDAMAKEAFESTGRVLGLALANSVAYTSPKVIYLFGGLAASGDFLLKPTVRSFEINLLNIYRNKVSIRRSSLEEDNAALLGAASLVFNIV